MANNYYHHYAQPNNKLINVRASNAFVAFILIGYGGGQPDSSFNQ